MAHHPRACPQFRCDAGHMVQAIPHQRSVSDGQPACAAVSGPDAASASACGGVSASTCRGSVVRGGARPGAPVGSGVLGEVREGRCGGEGGRAEACEGGGGEKGRKAGHHGDPCCGRASVADRGKPSITRSGRFPCDLRHIRALVRRRVRLPGRVAAPGPVVRAGLVDPLEAVRTEEVALRLQQVRGGPRRAHHVEIAERRRQRRRRDPRQRRLRHHRPEAAVGLARAARGSAARTSGSSPGRSPSACAMSSSIAERMMQPARQTRAIPAIGSDQPNSCDAASSSPKPWA